MNDDDRPVGRVLTRREALVLLGAGGLTGLAPRRTAAQTPATPACVVRPELTEGPFFVDEQLNRSDIRSDPGDGTVRPGVPLRLALRVSRLTRGACAPLPGAMVDLWHCDAIGVYSGVQDPGGSTVGKKFLRGFQTTDGEGLARFTTIYPGAYRGRAVHIHFKIRSAAAAAGCMTSPRSSSSTTRSATRSTPSRRTPAAASSACETRGTACIGVWAPSSCSR